MLTDKQQELLERQFPIHHWDGLTLEVNLDQERDIYKLMDILKQNETPIETINPTEINFEQVFRRLVQEGAAS